MSCGNVATAEIPTLIMNRTLIGGTVQAYINKLYFSMVYLFKDPLEGKRRLVEEQVFKTVLLFTHFAAMRLF